MDAMAEIRATFFEECDEQTTALDAGLAAMRAGTADAETVNVVFRAVHSVKGGAASFKFNELTAFARLFEEVLNEVRSGRLEPAAEVVATLSKASDVLADLIAVARSGSTVAAELKALLPASEDAPEEAEEAGDGSPGDGMDEIAFAPVAVDFSDVLGSAESRLRIGFAPRPELYANGNESARLIRELRALGTATVACDTSAIPPLDALDAEGAYLSWTIELTTTRGEDAVREIFDFAEFDCELTIEREMDPAADDGAAEAMDPEMAALFARLQGAA